jgi:uncharacterized protein YjdB
MLGCQHAWPKIRAAFGGGLKSEIYSKARQLVLLTFLCSAIGAMCACKGFFVDPTLSSITVTPVTPSVATGSTKQMTATGTYNDGSTKNITSSVSWSSSDDVEATVADTGLVTGVAVGTVSITATSASISGSTSVTITVASLQSIAVTPNNDSTSAGDTVQYTAIGTLKDGSTVDITDAVTWRSSDTSVATINSSGLATAQSVSSTQSADITATSGSITSNTAVLTVVP